MHADAIFNVQEYWSGLGRFKHIKGLVVGIYKYLWYSTHGNTVHSESFETL